jgi:redox-sensitive bicupin YhaK (pirin superfamily)
MTLRSIRKVITGKLAMDGAGVRLTRVVGFHDTAEFDPFLMLDAFDSTHPNDYIRGFPFHPHRGIETVTYLIAGEIEHRDSLGNSGVISSGDCQWMTAGSGIIHQEMPLASHRMLGVQLWLNLPLADKMTSPHYRDIPHNTIPVIETSASRTRIVSGSYEGIAGPANGDHIHMTSLDVEVFAWQSWSFTTDPESTVFTYIVTGSGDFGGDIIDCKHAVLFESGDTIQVQAGSEGIRFLLFMARPLHERIAWGGPVVMNTQEELEQAFAEIDNGEFVR